MPDSVQRGKQRRHIPLYLRVLLGVLLGAALGVLFDKRPILLGITNENLGTLGSLVIKLLRALAAPLILFAILDAFARTQIAAKHGGRLILICLVNVSVAMCIGLTILNVFQPGTRWQGHITEMQRAIDAKPMIAKKAEDPEAPERMTFNLIENLSYYVPSSLVKPFIYNNIITIVLSGLLGGAAFRRVKERQIRDGQVGYLTVERFVETVYQTLVQMLDWVVQTVPFAVFGIVAQVVGKAGLGVFHILWVFLATALAGLLLHSLVYYPLVAWVVGRKPPKVYLGQGADAIMTGLSTNSSLATVPVTLRCLEKMGVSMRSARLAACVGTNLNNDGITLYEAMTALFLAQAMGYHLNIEQQLIVVLASIMAGAGIAGIPEAGLIVLPLVLGAAGLPESIIALAIPLIFSVDWIIARCRSGVNVMSDMLVAILLDRLAPEEIPAETSPKGEQTVCETTDSLSAIVEPD
jgi:Na+/H+-dicarboxylate symporter